MEPADLRKALIAAMVSLDAWKIYLLGRNLRAVQRASEVPPELQQLTSPQEFEHFRKKTNVYTMSVILQNLATFSVKLVKLLTDYYPYVWALAADYSEDIVYRTVWFYGLDVVITRTALSIPLAVLSILLSPDTSDPFVSFIVQLIQTIIQALGSGLGALFLVRLTEESGPRCFAIMTIASNAIGVIAMALYIRYGVPVVLQPLPNNEVGAKVKALAQRVGYPEDRIFIDSKAASPPNAYFSSALGCKMIAISSSLTTTLIPDQLISVVAHELGHWHMWHPLYGYFFSALEIAAVCYVWTTAYGNDEVSQAFHLDVKDVHSIIPVYLTMTYVWPLMQETYSGLVSMFGRWGEFRADDYSSRLGYSASLKESILILSVKENGYPVLDSWFSAWFVGHPTSLERVRRIDKGRPHN